jgi:hypothetical protein
MKVHIPDYPTLEFPTRKTVEETRRILIDQGYTTVEGARARVEANGDIHFERNVGGEKA